jgi:carbamoyl-phosphate synthase/aspartate carbamoyltransferase/dihydroorotase
VEVDPDARWHLPQSGWHTRAGWSPFAGHEVRGRVAKVCLRGKEVFRDGTLNVEPGTGRVLF